MKVEFNALSDISEFSLGLFMAYGEDEFGEFHMTTIGLLLFEINLFKYKTNQTMKKIENLITCPKSGGDACIETKISPEMTTYFSMSCGFWTNSLMKVGEKFYEEQMQSLPELYKELAWEDPQTNLIWLPTNINLPKQGMIFAYGPNKESWGWGATKAIKEDGKWKMDLPNLKVFHERDFIEALDYLQIIH